MGNVKKRRWQGNSLRRSTRVVLGLAAALAVGGWLSWAFLIAPQNTLSKTDDVLTRALEASAAGRVLAPGAPGDGVAPLQSRRPPPRDWKGCTPVRLSAVANATSDATAPEYVVCGRGLTSACPIYSVGLGTDLHFDLALIRRFNATVYGFDGTVQSMKWLARERAAGRLPHKFKHFAHGLFTRDGDLDLWLPDKHVTSYSAVAGLVTGRRKSKTHIVMPVKRLDSIMRDLGHDHVCILKVDIEGAEFAVLEDMARTMRRFPFSQLVIEFHARFAAGDGFTSVGRAIGLLQRFGFHVFFQSRSGLEYTFVHESLLL